jgi:tRNA modification GTPase
LKEADLVLLVLDASRPEEQLDKRLIEKIDRKKMVTVFNKIDLKGALEGKKPILRKTLQKSAKIVKISAKAGTNIEKLLTTLKKIAKVDTFDTQQPVCITGRQEGLLKRLKMAESKDEAAAIVRELGKEDGRRYNFEF